MTISFTKLISSVDDTRDDDVDDSTVNGNEVKQRVIIKGRFSYSLISMTIMLQRNVSQAVVFFREVMSPEVSVKVSLLSHSIVFTGMITTRLLTNSR